MFRQRTKKGSDMSRMDKKGEETNGDGATGAGEALEEELEAELPVQEAQPQEAQPAPPPPRRNWTPPRPQAEEYLTLAQRVQADFDNFRRRNESVRADAYNEGIRSGGRAAAVMDNLERAVDAAKDSPDAQLREGVGLVLRQLSEVFQKQGITPIDRLGEKFDPNLEKCPDAGHGRGWGAWHRVSGVPKRVSTGQVRAAARQGQGCTRLK